VGPVEGFPDCLHLKVALGEGAVNAFVFGAVWAVWVVEGRDGGGVKEASVAVFWGVYPCAGGDGLTGGLSDESGGVFV
jgi:hypothetical protein